jgi:hypothetical protein
MYTRNAFRWFLVMAFMPLHTLLSGPDKVETYYFAIEMNGVLCGYSEITSSRVIQGGKESIELKQRMFARLSALGSQFDQNLKLTYAIDPATGNFYYHDSELEQGPSKMASVIHVKGDTAYFSAPTDQTVIKTFLPPDVVLPNTLTNDYLFRDFVLKNSGSATYACYEVREQKIHNVSFTRVGEETITMAGGSFDTVILDQLNLDNGLKLRMWLDKKSGMAVKTQYSYGRTGYLTDASVMDKVRVADMNKSILIKTNEAIANFKAISYLRVQARLEPTGLWITQDGLNCSGQKFTGAIKDNLIEGIFEIQYVKYSGVNAPPFPMECADMTLEKYLEPSTMLESDDPVLISRAREITAGSKNAWEAACRLSLWVAENIHGGIPGGVTARNTYDIRVGECGAHSLLLAAFCRGVGIPARVVWGCMYVPNMGGAFGQHGWTEIYMGEAGWIPVDATAEEIDYLDSGHIRIGEFKSGTIALNAQDIKILEYKMGPGATEDPATAAAKYGPYVGKYSNPAKNLQMILSVRDGNLTVDIPGKAMLAFQDADENGRWHSTLSDRLYLSFTKNDLDKINRLSIHEVVTMPKQANSAVSVGNVPAELVSCVGTYRFQAINKEFTIINQDNSLALQEPEGKLLILTCSDEAHHWHDQEGRRSIFFEPDGNGGIQAMKITYTTTLDRAE